MSAKRVGYGPGTEHCGSPCRLQQITPQAVAAQKTKSECCDSEIGCVHQVNTAGSMTDAQTFPAVTGPVQRVVVVGAGMAGLTVANALTQAGVLPTVLEARDRIGGRLHTG
jgi:NADPH-dependent 2,4-dienoyl-CoA reductase/sulfur reductase-like enzyme